MIKPTNLLTPDGEVYYELVYDINQRSAERWNRPWYPYPNVQEARTDDKGYCLVPKHPDLRPCPSC